MIRSILFAVAFSAIAGAASAEGVTVSLVGKDDVTIQADISKAAKLVCSTIETPLEQYGPCVSEAYGDAMAQIAKAKAAAMASK